MERERCRKRYPTLDRSGVKPIVPDPFMTNSRLALSGKFRDIASELLDGDVKQEFPATVPNWWKPQRERRLRRLPCERQKIFSSKTQSLRQEHPRSNVRRNGLPVLEVVQTLAVPPNVTRYSGHREVVVKALSPNHLAQSRGRDCT